VSAERYALTLSCPNRPGIVALVTGALFESGANILEAHQFDDEETGVFFARIAFNFVGDNRLEVLRVKMSDVATRLQMRHDVATHLHMGWSILDLKTPQRVLLLVSSYDHCLTDLLYRWRIGELAMEVAGIISNHPRETYRHLDFDGIPFDFLPVTKDIKPQQEAQILKIVSERNVDLVVLARYMQILSNSLSSRLAGRCINIHHSFLPSFKGARPYDQAHARGVKLIGATAHYVTADLDEGPIIEQDVERVSHHDKPEVLVRKGRDIERRVLSRAVAWHLDGRVILNGRKTVVFKD
jgi:formyltetrahydrofolate deformylase